MSIVYLRLCRAGDRIGRRADADLASNRYRVIGVSLVSQGVIIEVEQGDCLLIFHEGLSRVEVSIVAGN